MEFIQIDHDSEYCGNSKNARFCVNTNKMQFLYFKKNHTIKYIKDITLDRFKYSTYHIDSENMENSGFFFLSYTLKSPLKHNKRIYIYM